MIDDNEESSGERDALERVAHLLEDAKREGEIVAAAGKREAEDLGEVERELKELERPKTVIIVVDGSPHEVPWRERITYVEVVTLAHPDYPQHPEITYSVTYTKGPREKPEGTLPPGGDVKVKEGMSFVVNRTGQS